MPTQRSIDSPVARALRRGARAACAASAAVVLLAAGPAAFAQAGAASAAAPADALRPEVAAPLQAAQALIQEGKAREALPKVAEAEAVGGLTPYETMVVQRVRASAAQAAGDLPLTLTSLEAAIATGKLSDADLLGNVEAMVGIAARAQDHARVLRWSQRYIELNGPNDAVRMLRIQSQIASGDERGALSALAQRVEAADAAGRATPEGHLRTLASLQQRLSDPGAGKTIERLAAAYPRAEYWSNVVGLNAAGLAGNDRAMAALYRLLRAAGALTRAEAVHDAAERALRSGQPAEAQTLVDEGFAAGLLGTGAKAAEHQRLREQARKQAAADIADRPAAETAAKRAADGNALVSLGWSIVAALPANAAPAQAEGGLALIEQGIAKGGLKRASEARFQLGMAQLAAGRKDAARQTLTALQSQAGGDPLAVPIRLWAMFAGTGELLPPYKP
jgi:hypothetical protein